jgi:UDP-GlcNAc3NAcA epimerase
MKIVTIVGARPQFIKAAVLTRKLAQENDFHEVMIHTGQHYDKEMSADFFSELKIPEPAYNLGINNLSHAAMTGRMLEAIEPLLIKENPQLLVVYGDTNSTLAGALAAKKLQIPVAHIEAGLRSGDMKMPEEINRLITDRISDLLFCPTAAAVENLLKESFFSENIFLSGDIMYDASVMFAQESDKQEPVYHAPYALCTFHRQELIQSRDKLASVLNALALLNKEIPVILVTHPRTKAAINALGIALAFRVDAPLSYLQMASALKHCSFVITDSGGLQKEAYFFQKRCITVRENTEWKELVDAGVNFLAGDDGSNILSLYKKIKTTEGDFSKPLYGDGHASTFIINTIRQFLTQRQAI